MPPWLTVTTAVLLLSLLCLIVHILWSHFPLWIAVFFVVVVELLRAFPRGGGGP